MAEQQEEEGDPTLTEAKKQELNELQQKVDVCRQVNDLDAALEQLLPLEKAQRQRADVLGSKLVLVEAVRLCRAHNAWNTLMEYATLLSKRRAQLKRATAEMVREAASYLDHTPDVGTEVDLIKTLTDIATGKIFLEVEKARLTRRLAKIQESQGKPQEACDTLQEVPVETYGGLSKREKSAFILEQMRLLLDTNDFDKAQIISHKVQPRALDELAKGKKQDSSDADKQGRLTVGVELPSALELKRTYWSLMIRYYQHENNLLELCRCYQALYEDALENQEENSWKAYLKKVCWFVVLTQHGTMQQSLLFQVHRDRKLSELPLHRDVVRMFVTSEVIDWTDFSSRVSDEMEVEKDVFAGEHAEQRRLDLHSRVIEHNCIVVSGYYSRIQLSRLAELLGLSADEAESRLSDAVVNSLVKAKIDRPAGVVDFTRHISSQDELNRWVDSVEKMLSYVEGASHRISKEAMAHRVDLDVAG
jgi:26S proteasome regulatory subunit N5